MPHLLAEALEAAERVEHAVAPQELVGGCRQLVAVGAELQLLLAAMIVQIFRDDAILEHAAESDADAAGRPRKLSRQRVVGRQQHRAAQNQRQAALARPESAIFSRKKGHARKPRTQRPNSTPSVALWVAAANAVNRTSE